MTGIADKPGKASAAPVYTADAQLASLYEPKVTSVASMNVTLRMRADWMVAA